MVGGLIDNSKFENGQFCLSVNNLLQSHEEDYDRFMENECEKSIKIKEERERRFQEIEELRRLENFYLKFHYNIYY